MHSLCICLYLFEPPPPLWRHSVLHSGLIKWVQHRESVCVEGEKREGRKHTEASSPIHRVITVICLTVIYYTKAERGLVLLWLKCDNYRITDRWCSRAEEVGGAHVCTCHVYRMRMGVWVRRHKVCNMRKICTFCKGKKRKGYTGRMTWLVYFTRAHKERVFLLFEASVFQIQTSSFRPDLNLSAPGRVFVLFFFF